MPLMLIPCLFDTKRPIAIVPNLAIHMNRSVNDGVKLNRQKEMLPILMMKGKGAILKIFT